MDNKLSLKNGMDFMDKCLEKSLNDQRSMAHKAIDMDDWATAQEILAIAKRNISLVDDLKSKFSEFKKNVRAAEDIINGKDVVEQSEDNIPIDSLEDSLEVPDDKAAAPDSSEVPVDKAADVLDNSNDANEDFLVQLEELIVEFPFAMAVCNEAAGIGENFTYDITESKNMKKPAKLSNSLWVDTAISKSKADKLIKALREYGENSR